MNKLHFTLVPVAALLAGCAVDPVAQEEAPTANAEQMVTSFEFDSSALTKVTPKASIPSAHLTLDHLGLTNIGKTLLQTSETFTRVAAVGNNQMYKTSTWELEKDSITGRIFGLSSIASGPAVAQDEPTLQRLALDRLVKFGIGTGEIGKVLQRKSMLQDFDGTTPDAATLHGYKTFVFRAIGGVPVVGHRAVVTHGVDGVVRRVMLKWPALANSGHLLRTSLGIADIQARAASALARNGETTGKVYLTWQYRPVVTSTGEVTLRLMVGARMPSNTGTDGIAEEPRSIDVDVSAM